MFPEWEWNPVSKTCTRFFHGLFLRNKFYVEMNFRVWKIQITLTSSLSEPRGKTEWRRWREDWKEKRNSGWRISNSKLFRYAHQLARPLKGSERSLNVQSAFIFILIAFEALTLKFNFWQLRRWSNPPRLRIGAELFFESPRDLFQL